MLSRDYVQRGRGEVGNCQQQGDDCQMKDVFIFSYSKRLSFTARNRREKDAESIG